MFQQFIDATAEFIPISRVKQRQPCLTGHGLRLGHCVQVYRQLRSQFQQFAGARPFPPAGAQQALQGFHALALLQVLLLT